MKDKTTHIAKLVTTMPGYRCPNYNISNDGDEDSYMLYVDKHPPDSLTGSYDACFMADQNHAGDEIRLRTRSGAVIVRCKSCGLDLHVKT